MLLADQDRRPWHHDEIAEGLRLLAAAIRPTTSQADPAGERLAARYRLEAMIAAAHATAPTHAATDWSGDRRPLRRTGAVDRIAGRTAQPCRRRRRGRRDRPPPWPCSTASTTCWATARISPLVRGELLGQLGRRAEAAEAFAAAIAMATNEAERAYLQTRLDTVDGPQWSTIQE